MSDCRMMVVVETGAGAVERLGAALAAGDVASVVIAAAEGVAATDVRALIGVAQAAGAAALVQNDARLARTLKADGVHLSPTHTKMFAEAREIVGGGAVVGVDAGRSRHEAMVAGESGADYVAFGIPAHIDDRTKAHRRRCELIAWWAEIFEVPVVAFDVRTAEEAGQLAAAGADFIAAPLPSREPPAASGELVRAMIAAIADEVVA